MKTSSAIVLALVAAAAGALGYRMLTPKDAPAATQQAAKQDAKEEKAGNEHAEKDEHGADRIVISDVKLAAAGATFAEAGPATLTETLSFNGVLLRDLLRRGGAVLRRQPAITEGAGSGRDHCEDKCARSLHRALSRARAKGLPTSPSIVATATW